MNFVILDLEWNQSSEENSPKKLNFEIIEIGAIKLNAGKVMISEFSQLIRPQIYMELHKFTSRLIHLQMQELERGRPFPEVVKEFLEWCGEDFIFCTWGPLDLTELQSNMVYYHMPPLADGPFKFLDVQKLFSLAFEDGKSRRALEYAVDFLGIEKDIPFHRAFSDAYYTGKVLSKITDESILEKYSYDLFTPPQNREEEIHALFDNYAKYISRVFPNKMDAFRDKEVISSKCYLCHRNLKKEIKWFSPNGRNYYCLAHCDKHGFLKGKIRIKKTEDDQVFVVKTTKIISSAEADKIEAQQEHAKEIRKNKRKKNNY